MQHCAENMQVSWGRGEKTYQLHQATNKLNQVSFEMHLQLHEPVTHPDVQQMTLESRAM